MCFEMIPIVCPVLAFILSLNTPWPNLVVCIWDTCAEMIRGVFTLAVQGLFVCIVLSYVAQDCPVFVRTRCLFSLLTLSQSLRRLIRVFP